ncbi:MAG: AarF/ABC1/UbiB kinase family protein [Methanosarcinales archaeon]|nr:AarF/ABC1/UbiB kinase family protein [Methanosarcinales archaeon]
MSTHKINIISNTYRHIERYYQILSVLFKYGFEDLLDYVAYGHYFKIKLPEYIKKQEVLSDKYALSVRIRMAFEELGPTFIKMGQVLSTRPDLIPMEYVIEFEKLQDSVTPFSFDTVKDIIESELNAPLNEIFLSFYEVPIASASIGQVHKAVLYNKEKVAVKVQRPDIEDIVEIDLEILLHMATILEKKGEIYKICNPVNIVKEFSTTIRKELNYINEAVFAKRFARQFVNDPYIYVPKIYSDRTTRYILTMEFVSGIKISEIDELELKGYDKKLIAKRGANSIFKQIFINGFFHADPHPGNLLILPKNTICYLDFGMMGRLDKITRDYIIDYVFAIANRDEIKATNAILKLMQYQKEPNRQELELDILDLIEEYAHKPLKEIDTIRVLNQCIYIGETHGLQLSRDMFMMSKAMITIEQIGKMLDPNFNITEQSALIITSIYKKRISPSYIIKNELKNYNKVINNLKEIPRNIQNVLNDISKGKTKIKFEHIGLNTAMDTLERVSNRISFAIVLSSLIIGSSLIVLSNIPPHFLDIPLIGIIGFIGAGIMGIWLLISILTHGKM